MLTTALESLSGVVTSGILIICSLFTVLGGLYVPTRDTRNSPRGLVRSRACVQG